MKRERFCLNCGIKLDGEYQLKFCSRSCAVSYNNKNRVITDKQREKTSKSLKEYNKQNSRKKKLYVCGICGKEYYYCKGENTKRFCSKDCMNEYNKNRAKYMSDESKKRISDNAKRVIEKQGDIRRSKNEIGFCKLCEEYFDNVEHNVPLFNGWDADIIIHDYKIAILWNGNWHYKQISKTTPLKMVQNRDNIKIKEIENYGYIPYIIKDTGKYDEQKILKEFEKLKIFINNIGV